MASGLKGADVGGLRFTARLYDGSSVTLTRASLEDAKLDAQRIATQRNRPVHLRDRDNNLVEIFYPPPRPPRGLRPENAPRRGAIQFRTVGRENAAIVRPGPTPPPAKKPQRQQIAGRIRAAAQAMAAKVQAAMAELGPATLEARTQLIDSTAPIQDFMAAARAKGIPDNVDAGILARTYAGIYGRAENRIDYLDELIAPARRDADELFESMIYERFDELARRGVKKFPGGQTPLEVNAENARLKRQLAANPAKAKRIRDASGNIRSFTGQMLRELRDEGIISDESYRNSRANNRQYIPLQRVGFLADEIDTPGGPRGFSVASQDVVQSIVGSNRELLNPLESIVGNVYKATSLIGRNRVARAVAGLSKDPDYAGLVVPLKKGQEVPRGMEAIRYFENGKVKSFAVPKVVGDSLKGLQKEHADIVTKVAALSSKGLRAGATQYSVPFILPAAYRDFQQMQATLQIGPVEAGRVWMKGFAEVMGHGAYYRDWLEYGGSFSGRFQVLNFKQRTAKQLLQSKSSRIFWKAINPIGLIAKTNEIIDQSARVGTYRRERTKLGHGPDRAALKSRDVTVDFFRVGTKMRVANLWTPFLNARLQGNLNIYKAFRAHPGKTLLAMGPTVMVPAITTYFWNNLQFGDVLDDIESWEKENSFILIYGREKDSRGRYTQAVKIPKGDIGQVLGTSIENSLDYLRGRDYIAWHALGLQLLSNVSPIPFERDGKVSGGRSVSSVVPPLPKGMLEVTANYDYYRDRAIVSRSLADAPPEEQYYADTPAAAIHIGRFLGVAPAKVHHMFRAQFASVGDQGLRLLGGESPGIGRSVSRRFSGVSGGAIDERNFGELEDSKAQVAAVRVRAQRDAIRILEAAQAKPPGERVGHLRAEMAKIAAVDRDHAVMVHTQMDNEAEKRTMTPYERSLKGAPVKVRADVILARLREMTPEQRGEYVRSMGAKGILSEAVDAELTQRARARTAPGPAN